MSSSTKVIYKLKVIDRQGPNEDQWVFTESFYLSKSGRLKGLRTAVLAAIAAVLAEIEMEEGDDVDALRSAIENEASLNTKQLLKVLDEVAQLPYDSGEQYSFKKSTHALLP